MASGIASPYFEMDSHGDLMLPGCYKGADQAFVDGDATVMLAHWQPLPIGVCTKANGDTPDGLAVDFVYHTHPEAESAYTVAKERFALGKGTGLSVGIRILASGYVDFQNGQQMLDWLEAEGYDLALVKNIEKIRAWARWCSVIRKVNELFEFSQVCVGSARSAQTDMIKSALGGDGSRSDLTLSDHFAVLLSSTEGLVRRYQAHRDWRKDNGRSDSRDRLDDAKSLHTELGTLIKTIEDGLASHSNSDFETARLRSRLFLLKGEE